MSEYVCPECGSPRNDFSRVCAACGAPPSTDHRQEAGGETRSTDLEPYLALSYIAKLFKILAVLMLFMLLGEVALGLIIDGRSSLVTLIGEATRLLVIAGLLWAGADVVLLMIDFGHDVRVARILLGRINAKMHEDARPAGAPTTEGEVAARGTTTPRSS